MATPPIDLSTVPLPPAAQPPAAPDEAQPPAAAGGSAEQELAAAGFPMEGAPQDALQDQYGTPGQEALSFLEGLGSGATAGLSRNLEQALGVSPEGILGREQANPWTHGIGEGLGLGGLLLATGGLGAEAEAGEAAAGVGSKMLQGAVTQGIWGATHDASDQLLNENPEFNAESVLTAGGLNFLLGGASEGLLWGGGKAVGAAGNSLKGPLQALGSAAATGALGLSSLATGEDPEVLRALAAKAVDAAKAGGFGKLFQGVFEDTADKSAAPLRDLVNLSTDKAAAVREMMRRDFENSLVGADIDPIRAKAQELVSAARDAVETERARNPYANKTILGQSRGEVETLTREDVERELAQRTGLPPEKLRADPQFRQAVDDELARRMARTVPTGVGTGLSGALDLAEDRIGKAKTAYDVWEAVDELRAQAQQAIPSGIRSGEIPAGAYRTTQVAQRLSDLAQSFTKSEELFPRVGDRWAGWQMAHSRYIYGRDALMSAAGAKEFGERVISNAKVESLLRGAFEGDAYKARVIDEFIDATRTLDEAGDSAIQGATPYNPGKIAAAQQQFRDLQQQAIENLGLKEVAKRLGGDQGFSLGSTGLFSYLISRATGAPYAPIALALGAMRAAQRPAAAMLTVARLAKTVGAARSLVESGARGAVSALFAGAKVIPATALEAARAEFAGREPHKEAHGIAQMGPQDVAEAAARAGHLPSPTKDFMGLALGRAVNAIQAATPPLTADIGGAPRMKLSRHEEAKFLETRYLASHPEHLYKELEAHNVDPRHVAVVAASNPAHLSEMRKAAYAEVVRQAPKGTEDPLSGMSQKARRALAIFGGGDTLPAGFSAAMQASLAAAPPPPPPPGGIPRKFKFRSREALPYRASQEDEG